MNRIRKYALYLLLLVYFCGSIGIVFAPQFFLPFSPISLLLTAFVFMVYQPYRERSYVLAFAGMALLGFVCEVLGVNTGLVFGEYRYGDSLGPKLAAVPLCIALNWAMLVNAGLLVVAGLISSRFASALACASLVTALDLLIEQSAAALDYWYFEDGRAGLHNYAGWFLTSFAGAYLFHGPLHKGNARMARIILLLQLFFFGTIYLYNRLFQQS